MTTWDRGLVKVVNAASAAVSEPSQWEVMLDALNKRFHATASAIFARPATPDVSPPLATALNLPPDGMRVYLDQWVQHDPWLAAARRAPMVSGNCYIGREVCDWPELDRSTFYNEFSKFQGVRGLLSLLVDDGLQPARAGRHSRTVCSCPCAARLTSAAAASAAVDTNCTSRPERITSQSLWTEPASAAPFA